MPRRWDKDPFEKKEPRDDDGEREKRSWSEVDKMRDRSRHVTDDRKPPSERKSRASAAYGKYKSELNRLFDKGGIAEKFKDALGGGVTPSQQSNRATAGGDGAEASQQEKQARALRAAEGPEFLSLLKDYVAAHGMPEAVDVLVKAATADDIAIVKDAVRKLTAKAAGERIPGRAAMLERLRTFSMTTRDPELDALVADLRAALGI